MDIGYDVALMADLCGTLADNFNIVMAKDQFL